MQLSIPLAAVTAASLFVGACAGDPTLGENGAEDPVRADALAKIDEFNSSVERSELVALTVPLRADGKIRFEEAEPGVMLVAVSGEEAEGLVQENGEIDALGLYQSAMGDDADSAVVAQLQEASVRTATLHALLEDAPPPAEQLDLDLQSNAQQKSYNPNTCNRARSYWTNWFHDTKCSNGQTFGSGWSIHRWPGTCSDRNFWYDVPNAAWFVVNNDGAGSSSCSRAEVDRRRWTGSYWATDRSYHVSKGTWAAWYWTARYQQWELGPVRGQCRPTELFGCHLRR